MSKALILSETDILMNNYEIPLNLQANMKVVLLKSFAEILNM